MQILVTPRLSCVECEMELMKGQKLLQFLILCFSQDEMKEFYMNKHNNYILNMSNRKSLQNHHDKYRSKK